MNTNMYENFATQENLEILKSNNIEIFEPTDGFLACGDVGKGRLAEPCDIVEKIV